MKRIRIRDLLEYATLKYLKKNINGECITNIAKHTGMGKSTAKEVAFKLLKENKIKMKEGIVNSNKYHTLIFYIEPAGEGEYNH